MDADNKPNTKLSFSDRLQQCYTGAVYDVLRAMGYPDQVLPYNINPLNIHHKITGTVFTVEGKRNNTISEYDSLLKWCELLSRAPSGHVIICQPHDTTVAHMGELSAETLLHKEVRGYIVDGGCRDTAFIEKINFPVFCKYLTPVDVVTKWEATSFAGTIVIGKVKIHTGDYVIADRDGIVIIPLAIVEEVINQTEKVLQTENRVRTAILKGVDPVEAYKRYGKF